RSDEDIRGEREQFRRVSMNVVGRGVADVDPQIEAVDPAQLLQGLCEHHATLLSFRIVPGVEHPDAPHPLALLRARRNRPRRRAAKQADELPPPHSITSSARASNVGGISRPSALAVLRLMTSRYLIRVCTGRSAALAPRRIWCISEAD